jgi:hypothetical protein
MRSILAVALLAGVVVLGAPNTAVAGDAVAPTQASVDYRPYDHGDDDDDGRFRHRRHYYDDCYYGYGHYRHYSAGDDTFRHYRHCGYYGRHYYYDRDGDRDGDGDGDGDGNGDGDGDGGDD